MADYYKSARQAKKDLKDVSVQNKRRRLQRQEAGLEDDGVEHPLNYLTIEGRGSRIHRNPDTAVAIEEGLIPWNGDAENLIDRFDARSLLDFYKDPPAGGQQQRQRTPQEEKLQQVIMGVPLAAAAVTAWAHLGALAPRSTRQCLPVRLVRHADGAV